MVQENKLIYIDFCKKVDMSIFSQPWWLDAVCGKDNWNVSIVEKGGNIFATMPYYIENKLGFSIIKNPKLTQTMGIYFNYPKNQKYYKKLSFEKEMIDKLLMQLPKFDSISMSFNYNYSNLLPFYWHGFKSSVSYTYIIDNIPLEELEEKFKTDVRRRRRKAEKLGVIVYEDTNIEDIYRLSKMTFERQGINIPYSFNLAKNIYSIATKHNSCKMFFAKYDNEVIAAIFLIYDNNSVYYIMGGIDPDKKNLGAMDLLQHESIKFAIKSNRIYNFEGSMIESIEKYFRSFGSIQKPYYQIKKTNSKLLKLRECLK